MKEVEKKYRFADFTLQNYEKLLTKALNKKCKFVQFNDKFEYFPKDIILRHDLEFSPTIALEMAKIEKSLGIKSTVFVQLHGDFYNALEKKTFDIIKNIETMGHEVGLHFDSHYWPVEDESDLQKYLSLDNQVFEIYFQKPARIFSFHNNNKFTLSCELDTYAGMHNVYCKHYKTKVSYCADSTGYWRYEVLEDKIRILENEALQLLIHDGMWQNKALPPRRRVFEVINNNAANLKRSYDNTLSKFGAKNIDWNGEITENI